MTFTEIDVAVAAIVLSIITVLVLWLLPRWQTAKLSNLTPEARFDKENESRKTLAQMLGAFS